jgi:hypothetical protein
MSEKEISVSAYDPDDSEPDEPLPLIIVNLNETIMYKLLITIINIMDNGML